MCPPPRRASALGVWIMGEWMSLCRAALVVLVLLPMMGSVRVRTPPVDPWPRTPQEALPGYLVHTEHFSILSTAHPDATAQAALALEDLFSAYQQVVGPDARLDQSGPLRVRLYADRSQFKAHRAKTHWTPGDDHHQVSHGYADTGAVNAHHWLLHEVVHQMNHRLPRAPSARWLNEGLAAYLGSSRSHEHRMRPGEIDTGAYPVWWLGSWQFVGRWEDDEKAERVIPLRALITNQGGPSPDLSFNAYHVGYWSLTHFLLHHEQGKYASSYRQLLLSDGSLEAFERLVGPVDQVQGEWYTHLLGEAEKCRASATLSLR